ncbi:MAG: sensor histidine kinase [Brachymonas sp.]
MKWLRSCVAGRPAGIFAAHLAFMNKAQILNPHSVLAQALEPAPRPERIFDTCKVGIVLRAVLGLEAVAGSLMLFGAQDFWSWFFDVSSLTVGMMPAALLWLLTVCAMKNRLEHASRFKQLLFLLVMGGLCGFYAGVIWGVLQGLQALQLLACVLLGMQAALGMMVYLIWRAAAKQPAATSAQLVELQARIRPHFLFNTLNSAIALIRSEPRKAERVLEDLSELFRAALAERDATVTLGQEIALAQHYLAIEQVRFGQRLRVHWQLDPSLEQVPLPLLILQPLVENAVKHGVEPSSAGADITVLTQRRGQKVHIRVSNTLPEEASKKGHGMALRNVRDRLLLLHDVECDFRAGIKSGQYQVRIEVPLHQF